MLKFDQIPHPTVAGTELDPGVVRTLAYGMEDRGINGVAEVCAAIVVANTTDIEVIKGIGEKAGQTIADSKKSKYPEEDGGCFMDRFDKTVLLLVKGTSRSEYRQLIDDARRKENGLNLV